MDKKKIVKAIKNWNEKQESRTYTCIFPEDLSAKQIANIKAGFGKDAASEEWIAVYDDSFGRKGKKGFLFTENGIYGSSLREPLVWDELKAIWSLESLYTAILYRDGRLCEAKGTTIALQKITPVIQEILGMKQGESVPKESYVEFHSVYGRELRRRLVEFFKRKNEENKELKLAETLAEEVVQNAIISCKAEVNPEQILALWLFGQSGKRGIVFTEDMIYSSNASAAPLFLDGLTQLMAYSKYYYCGIYDNDYACKVVQMVSNDQQDTFFDIVQGIVAIYRELLEEVGKKAVKTSGMDIESGWEVFEKKLQNNEIETYKNALFVSSTFKDMHFERDIIHEKVHPALNVLAKKYGETLSFCDLRWGVNTENLDSDEGAKKVLIVCLDEIERCDPYMLIMLGERYGWIPDSRIIENALEGRRDFELQELESSVTALEIEFGALAKQARRDHIFVYFREMEEVPSEDYNSESELHAQKLEELKNRVRRLAPDRVKTYTLSWDKTGQSMQGIEEFAQMVIEDIGKVMEQAWKSKEKLTSFETEISKHWSYAEQKAAQCHAREDVLKAYLKKLEEGNHLLALTGVSGCGKSTIMGALATILKYSNTEVLPLFSAYTECAETGMDLVQNIVYYLENLLEEKHYICEKEEEWINRMNMLTEQYSKEKETPVVILIDAIDQLVADSVRDNLKFIPQNIDRMDSKVYMVFSCLTEFNLVAVPVKNSVPMIDKRQKATVITGILRRNRRELEQSVINEIEKKAASNSPLYVTLLIQRLLMMNKNDFDDIVLHGDGMSEITRHQLEIIAESGETISEICKEMIEMAAERMGGEFVEVAIEYIRFSRYGLRESDLQGLMKKKGIVWNRLEFSIFINYLRNIFVLREDGCYDFSHKIIRKELSEKSTEDRISHKELADWFAGLEKEDSLREKELAYHLIKARDQEKFVNYVEKEICQGTDNKLLIKDITSLCHEDGGAWIAQVIRECNRVEFVKFISKELRTMFSAEGADVDIREKLVLAVVEATEAFYEESQTEENKYELSVAYSRLGKVYELKGDGRAIDYFEKSLILSEALAEEIKSIDRRVDVGIDYRMLANAHEIFDNDKELKKSLFYCQKSIDLLESVIKDHESSRARISLGWSYKRMGDFYGNLKEKKLSEKHYEACRKIRECVVKEEASERNVIDLCSIYDILASNYKEDNCSEKALELYEKMISYYENIVRENRTLDNMKKLAWAYSDAGFLYYFDENTDKKGQALTCFEKSAPIFEEVLRQKENMYMLWSLADNYKYSVKILRKAGGVENKKKAEILAKRALELYEYRAVKTDDNDAYESWDLMLRICVITTENINMQIECLTKSIELNEMLYKRTRDKKFKKEISTPKKHIAVLKMSKKI